MEFSADGPMLGALSLTSVLLLVVAWHLAPGPALPI